MGRAIKYIAEILVKETVLLVKQAWAIENKLLFYMADLSECSTLDGSKD